MLFAAEGAAVAIADVDGEGAGASADAVLVSYPEARVLAITADIAREEDAARAVEGVAGAFGGLDALVNNAVAREIGPLSEASTESWRRIVDVNVLGLANCCRHALPWLRQSAKGPSIVNVSSAYALVGRSNWGQYDATKAAMLAMTRTFAIEEADHGVRVNAVCPGSTLTPWTLGRAAARGMTEQELKESGAAPALIKRWGEPEEIAYPILWLASDEASFVTGATLAVDGGLSAI